MDERTLNQLYDAQYAAVYDERFLTNPMYEHVAAFEVDVLRGLLTNARTWLDAACGTGYFLSLFPDVARAGFDLSDEMLARARARNTSADFLERWDFRSPRADWEGRFDVVSCMWAPYCYADTLSEIDEMVANLSDWTAPGGSLFLPLVVPEDVLDGLELRHRNPAVDVFGGPVTADAVIWSYTDPEHGREHRHLISPHIEHLIAQLADRFETVDTLYYPPYPPPVPGQRKGLLATGKAGAAPLAASSEALAAIRAASERHRADALPAQQLDAQEQTAAPEPGWARRAWRRSPARLRALVRRWLGERG